MAELMGSRNLLVINDEAHHCYREKPPSEDLPAKLTADQKDDAKKNTEAARLWISGIEAVNRQLKVAKVVDLSATPFFLAGSGYIEGSLFPWTVSDFSLMDAIECGIVKLPRVPVEDNLPLSQSQAPMYRELWQHIKKEMPRTAQQAKALSPLALPAPGMGVSPTRPGILPNTPAVEVAAASRPSRSSTQQPTVPWLSVPGG
jgi:type III restriction enzyme